MNRRKFLGTLAALPALSHGATDGIKLGFDTYSLRAFGWKAMQLIDYAAGLQLDTIQISSLGDIESLEPAHLAKVKAHAAQKGIALDGGMGCICPKSKAWGKKDPKLAGPSLVEGLKVAKALGATSMRVYMGSSDDRIGRPIEECMESTIGVFKSVRSQALDLGVKIAIENHSGDMTARETRTLIEEAGKDYVASCLDTGNPMWVMEHPMTTLEILGPYCVTTHVRDSIVFQTPEGAAAQWVVLGEGVVEFKEFMAMYKRVCPGAAMQLEVITGRPPRSIPYGDKEYWRMFPKMPAGDFAKFLDLAKNGHPFMGAMVVEDVVGKKPVEYTAALREQQRVDLEKSLEYAKKVLGVGVRWRG